MGARTRFIVGFMSVLLAFSGSSTTMAQSDSQEVVAMLTADVCAIDLRIFEGSLGTWSYDGTVGAYVLTVPGSSRVTIEGRPLSQDAPAATCDWAIAFSGLTGPGGTIDTTHFRAITSDGTEVDPAGFTVAGITGGYYFDYVLDSVPTYVEGAYTGHIDVTVTDAA